jgi:hypothetical protein
MESVMSQIIDYIAILHSHPIDYSEIFVVRIDKHVDGVIAHGHENDCEYRWKHQPVSRLTNELRIDW